MGGGRVTQVWGRVTLAKSTCQWMCVAGQCWVGGPMPMRAGAASRPALPAPSTKDGMTPLHCAVRNGHKDVAALLLERGADKAAKGHVSGPCVVAGGGS